MSIFKRDNINMDWWVLEDGSEGRKRIKLLREQLLKGDSSPRISMYRARLFTQAWKKYSGLTPLLRKARSFYDVMDGIPIPVIKGQLLAGSPISFEAAVEIYPEHYTGWLLEKSPGKQVDQLHNLGCRSITPVYITDEEINVLEEEILSYWKDKYAGAYVWGILAEDSPQAFEYIKQSRVFMTNFGKGFSHTIQDYISVVNVGLSGLKDEIKEGAGRMNFELSEAMIICIDAVILYAKRCAKIYEDLGDPESKLIAQICRNVPEGPANSWQEALQSIHFMHMSTFLAEGGVSHSFGRMDNYLKPFYRQWVEDGNESFQRAQEVLECFFLKCYEYRALRDEKTNVGIAGDRTNDKITLAGVDEQGNDAVNNLSYRFLEAHAHLLLKEPNLSVRVHKNISPDFLKRTMEVVRLGGGLPQFINDDVIIPSLVVNCGVGLTDALNYADVGCAENYIDPNSSSVKADSNANSNAGFFNLVKILELVLYSGVNPLNGKQVGPRTPKPEEFIEIENLTSAFLEQLAFAIKCNVLMNQAVERVFSKEMPCPYLDLMHPGPRRSGVGYLGGGCKYNWIGGVGVGLATLSDSLMVIEELIYRRKTCSWGSLLSAIRSNWQGFESLRGDSLKLSRYGSCGKRSEHWAGWIVDNFSKEYSKYSVARGAVPAKFVVGLFSMGMQVVLGNDVLATPDGRFAKEMLSGSVGPSRYAQSLGYTSTHNAAAGIGTIKVTNGITFNQIVPFNLILNDRELNKLTILMKTYFELGGMSVQYSVVNREELVRAQDNPEEFHDLIVRVGGYSARFIDLPRDIQDEIIMRAV